MSVGPITFSHPVARAQLLEEGRVYTFRSQDRTTGETWARKERLGEKIADVTVERVACLALPSSDLLEEPWAVESGFGTPEDWWNAICDVHGEPDTGYVYLVERDEE